MPKAGNPTAGDPRPGSGGWAWPGRKCSRAGCLIADEDGGRNAGLGSVLPGGCAGSRWAWHFVGDPEAVWTGFATAPAVESFACFGFGADR